MARILDYQAVEPLRRFNKAKSFIIPRSPKRARLASIQLRIPANASLNNKVELIATVGVQGVTGIAQLVFRIFRDGKEIFRTQQGVESAGSEQNYVVAFQAIDFNLRSGAHVFTLTVENITAGTRADVVGPISFSGKAIKRNG
ncbi:exosporium protein C [Paenibacillus filicis]|uniref:Exosporium protein C n=1 Tax=Paenibacillus gyeongsangnamensis TaxID=3388067 RepID=A0ABT4Q4P8_9BACL|nr:exosporium protein C [Paenibacillus filicis]MCZ8511798.1 exosporium protein C [Paenibacillus filicis]